MTEIVRKLEDCPHISYVEYWCVTVFDYTVEPVLKDQPIGHKKYGLSRQVVFGDRFIYTEM